MLFLSQLTDFPVLFRDYVQQADTLKPYYHLHYTTASLEALIAHQACKKIDRTLLYNVLTEQYKDIPLCPAQKENLLAIKDENTFTVTTGHQLCLFGGPWFVAYKILATIAYAHYLQTQTHQYKIIPIFWLASEDHDVAEVQTIYSNYQKIHYATPYQGITGNMPLQDIEPVLDLLIQTFHQGLYVNKLKDILIQSYHHTFTLSKATRLFIQKLFGELGILVLDAHHSDLKAKLLPIAEKEITQQTTYATVTKTIHELHRLNYKTYANPNTINLFYIHQNNKREKWNNNHTINPNRPQDISPNVLLRPVYQEIILPNLAYIGGPTEIAYWLELKSTFEAFNVPYPVLVPRYFGVQLGSKYHRKIQKYAFNLYDILNLPEHDFLARYFQGKISQNNNLSDLERQLQAFNKVLLDFAHQQKLGLEQSAMATVTRIEKEWKHFYTKIRKESQKREKIVINAIKDVYYQMLPFGKWQERTMSYLSAYSIYGNNLWEHILQKPITEPYFWIWEI